MGQDGIVDIKLGGESDPVIVVRSVDHPHLRRGEGDDLAGRGHAGVQAGGGEGLVPGTAGLQLGVLGPVRSLKAAVRPAGVEDRGPVGQVSAPLPGAAGGSGGRVGAVDG